MRSQKSSLYTCLPLSQEWSKEFQHLGSNMVYKSSQAGQGRRESRPHLKSTFFASSPQKSHALSCQAEKLLAVLSSTEALFGVTAQAVGCQSNCPRAGRLMAFSACWSCSAGGILGRVADRGLSSSA